MFLPIFTLTPIGVPRILPSIHFRSEVTHSPSTQKASIAASRIVKAYIKGPTAFIAFLILTMRCSWNLMGRVCAMVKNF